MHYIAYILKEKNKGGFEYYTLNESRRLPGKKSPSRVRLQYIGSEEDLIKWVSRTFDLNEAAKAIREGNGADENVSRTDPPTIPDLSFRAYIYGSPIALFKTAELVEIEKILDQCFPKKTVKGQDRSRVFCWR